MSFTVTGTYTDLYQITMAQAYFEDGIKDMPVVFDYFFRKTPFEGGYVVFAGLDDLIESLADFRFGVDEIDYLKERGFHTAFLNYLKNFRFQGSLFSVSEGEVVFPTEPIIRVEGNIIEAQLIETLLLNILNFESLIATKAARIRSVAGDRILSEFGLRRAQGYGGLLSSRAAAIGGFDSTSNVLAAQKYGLQSEGTMAHSYIQLYGDEETAFRKFAEIHPENAILLVDTYDTLKSGVPNAIKVAKEMEARGDQLRAIRLDSGDLSFLATKSREMLDQEGLQYVKIAASNQLDENVVRSLLEQDAPIDVFGIGTSLATGKPDAALDGVYKLAMAGDKPRIKVSENIQKITLPGRKQLYRFFNNEGKFHGVDGIALEEEGKVSHIIHPFEPHKNMHCKNIISEPLLNPVMVNGVVKVEPADIKAIQNYSKERLALLPSEYKRFENPHVYKVGISQKLNNLRDDLRQKHQVES